MRTVAVVIPARDAAASLPQAIRSAAAQIPAPAQIVVATPDEATRDAALGGLSAVDVVDNPAGTTPAGLNAAIGATDAEVIVRLDAHAVLPAGYIAAALEALEADPRIGNVGGRQVPVAAGGFAAAVAAAMRSPLGAGGATYRTGTTAGPVDTVYLGVFRREALEAAGGFDERMLRNQDYELNIRLRAAGWTVWFDPRLEVAYTPRGTVGALARQYAAYGRYRRLTARLHPGTLRLRQLAPPLALVVLALALIVGIGWPAVPLVAWAGYALLLLAGGFLADARRAVRVAVALAVMHLSWAVGFLLGPPGGAEAAQ